MKNRIQYTLCYHRRNHHGDRSQQLLRPWDHQWVGPSQLLGPVRQCNVHIGGKWIHSDVYAADQFTCSRIGIGPHDLAERQPAKSPCYLIFSTAPHFKK